MHAYIHSTLKDNQWYAFGSAALAGDFQAAALHSSTFFAGQDHDVLQDVVAGVVQDKPFREPDNAVMVMYNARFWYFGAVHDCNVLISSGVLCMYAYMCMYGIFVHRLAVQCADFLEFVCMYLCVYACMHACMVFVCFGHFRD
jgi:hypothetical protein